MNGRYKWTVWEKYPYTDTQLGKYHWRNIQNAGLREWNNFWGFRFNRILRKGKQAIFSAVALYGTVTHNSTLGNKYLWWFISFQSGAANAWHILLVKYIKSGNTQIGLLFLEKKQNICNLYEFPSFFMPLSFKTWYRGWKCFDRDYTNFYFQQTQRAEHGIVGLCHPF